MNFSLHPFFIASVVLASPLLAGPKIQFDKKSSDAGTIVEAQTKVVTTVFEVKNTGDGVLKLEKVRPSCPCVSIKYDSVIEPGKAGRIESFIDTKGFHSGPMSKFIMVASNAKNDPTAKLTVSGLFQATIDVSERYLSFNTATGKIRDTLYLSSKKADLHIITADFRSYDENADKSNWQGDMNLAIAVNPLARDSTRADGYKVFGYELIAPSVKKSQEGQIVIKTNHPDKPEVLIQGNILK
jgi:hypothetical protein